MGVMFGRFDVDETAETVPYTRRVVRDITLRLAKKQSETKPTTRAVYLIVRGVAFSYFAFAAWTALEYLIRELG